MVNTRPAVDPLASAAEKYWDNPWVHKLSRDYRERKLNLVKTANNEQTLKMISLLKKRVMSDGVFIAAESEAKMFLSVKVSDLQAQKNQLESVVNQFQASFDLMKKREKNSQLMIQRLSVKLQQCHENTRDYRALKKTLQAEKNVCLLLDENYKTLVASKGLNSEMLKTMSEKFKKTLLSPVGYTAEELRIGKIEGKEGRIPCEKEDEITLDCENLDEFALDDMAEFSKLLSDE